jgi:hypothetical protein
MGAVVGHLRQGDLTFLSHVRRFLVIAKPDKFTVPQMVIPGPFHEFDLRYQLGLHPLGRMPDYAACIWDSNSPLAILWVWS